MEPFVRLFGPLDALHGVIVPVLVALVFVNMVTRFLAHRSHESQYADGGAEAVSRFVPHELSNVVLLLASFYYLTVSHEAGLVTSLLVLTLVVTDFFEFEGRKVEARREIPLERPKAALAAWGLTLLYVGYQLVFTGPIGSLV